jgi:ADP-ribose pyrophosphatase YjhB (NUDIX family)
VTSELRTAVAAVIRRPDGLVLAVRRPDEPGEELPNIWGLPATTLASGETPADAIRRLGQDKLGVAIEPLCPIAEGEQQRVDYTLHMTVYEVSMSGEPQLPSRAPGSASTLYDAIDWLPAGAFREAEQQGSLCCRLFLQAG